MTKKQYQSLLNVFAGNFAGFPDAPGGDNKYAEFGVLD